MFQIIISTLHDFSAAVIAAPEEVQQPKKLSSFEYVIEVIKGHYELMFWFIFTFPIFCVMVTIAGAIVIEYLADGRKKTWASENAYFNALPKGRKIYTVWVLFLVIATVIAFFVGMQVFWWSEWWKDV